MMQKPLLIDGAMGTVLMEKGYHPPFENLAISNPDVIRSIHQEYVSAGSQILLTHTFNAQSIEQCEAAWDVIKNYPAKKFLSIGPHANVELLINYFKDKTERIVFETIYNLEIAKKLISNYAHLNPIFSFCLKPQDFKIALSMLKDHKLTTIGLNCLDGLNEAEDLLKMIPTQYEIYFKPNTGKDKLAPQEFTKKLLLLQKQFQISYLGGCCGTTPSYIMELQKALKDM